MGEGSEEGGEDDEGALPVLSAAERRAVRAAGGKAYTAALAEGRRAAEAEQVSAQAGAVDAFAQPADEWLATDATAVAAIFGEENDPDTFSLLAAIFRSRPDMLVRLQREVAALEAAEAAKLELRTAFAPKATIATAQTSLAAGLSLRFINSTLRNYWRVPSEVLGLPSIFGSEREQRAFIAAAAKQFPVDFTPATAPADSSLSWTDFDVAGAAFDVHEILQRWISEPSVELLVDIDDKDPSDLVVVVLTMDGRRDGRLPRCLWTAKIANARQVALAVTSALTVALADGDDHAGSLPHAWRVVAFVKQALAGNVQLNVRGVEHPVVVFFCTDSVACYEQSMHSSALADKAFSHNGATKAQRAQLQLYLPVTHDAETQQGMHDNTRARWHESHEVGEAPSKATVDVWAREYEGIKDVNPYGIDMRYWIPGPLHKARARC